MKGLMTWCFESLKSTVHNLLPWKSGSYVIQLSIIQEQILIEIFESAGTIATLQNSKLCFLFFL